MKAIKFLLLSICSLLLLSACSKPQEEENVLNANRGTNYTYDFVNYLTFDINGPDGEATLEVYKKDINITNFANETEYITLKKAIDEFYPKINIDKSTGLTNGDIITISIESNYSPTNKDLSINLEPCQFLVSGLEPAVTIDLFSDGNIGIYGLAGTNEVYSYVKSTSGLVQDIQDNMIYTFKSQDLELVANKTIVTGTAKMSDEFLQKNSKYKTTDAYLKSKNYHANLTEEKVLTEIVDEIDLKSANQDMLVDALYEALSDKQYTYDGKEYTLSSIASLQDFNNKAEHKHEIAVTSIRVDGDANQKCIRNTVKVVFVNGEYTVLSIGNNEPIKLENCQSDSSNTKVVANLDIMIDNSENNNVTAEEQPAAESENVK